MSSATTLTLASTSPRRREILATLGLDFDVVKVATDERALPGEAADDLTRRLAIAKAHAAPNHDWVLGADTVVVLGNRILGKPSDQEEAIEMLLALSGNRHKVLTGVALKTPTGTQSVVSSTEVEFREIDPDEARRYWHSGEPADKAGGYGIQGLGGLFVAGIHGSFTGVMGLPVFETAKLLATAGIDVLSVKR